MVIFNAWHSSDANTHHKAVHQKQVSELNLSGHEWIQHCVTHREWPHYLWLQIIRSSYISQHGLHFQLGKSHKDILWTVQLAACNGRFYVSDVKDYRYITNTTSITHRSDYYDVRAMSYIDIIGEIIRLAKLEQNQKIAVFLYRHALVEARHFLGLYRKKVQNRAVVKASFQANLSWLSLFKGISSFSDVFFTIRLMRQLLWK